MKKIAFIPRFSGPIQGHAINVVKKFYPSLCAEHEFDDLLQEAHIVFLKCRDKYKDTVDNRAWFMALFSRSLHNKFINMVAVTGRYISIEEMPEEAEPGTEIDVGFMQCVMRELPQEIRSLILTVCGSEEYRSRAAYQQLKKLLPIGD